MAEALPTTGVVLAALDEFSANMRAYVTGLAQVGDAEEKAAAGSGRAAKHARDLGEQHKLGAEKMARYALGASIVTGQLQQMGISTDKITLPMTVLFTTMTEGFNPTGAILIGVGLLASKLVSVFTEAQRLREETDKLTASLAGMAAAGGVQSEAERAAVARDLAAATEELARAQTVLDTATRHRIDGEKGYIGNFNKEAALRDEAAALKTVRDLQARMTSDSLALAGGSDAAAAAQARYAEQTRSAAAASKKAADALREQNAAMEKQLDDLSVAVAAHDDKFLSGLATTNAHFADKAKKWATATATAQINSFRAVTAAGIASAQARGDAEEQAAQRAQAAHEATTAYVLQSAVLVGQALGGVVMGGADAARQAGYVILDIMKTAVEKAIGISAVLNPWNLAKLVLVEAAFAAGKAALAQAGRPAGGSVSATPPAPSYGGYSATGTGYEGGYYAAVAQQAPAAGARTSAAAPIHLHYHDERTVQGDVSPETRRQLRDDAEDALYRVGPVAAQRAAALGRRAA